jgi:hypothetical protein
MSNTATKIAALGEKIHAYCLPEYQREKHIDKAVVGDDLQYNITSILAEFLIASMLQPATKHELELLLADHNTATGTAFKFDYFFNKGWIRLINGRFHVASLIRSAIWKIESPQHYNPNGNPIPFEDEIKAMIPIHARLYSESCGWISGKVFEKIISKYAPGTDVDFFVKRQIVEVADSTDSYKISRNGNYIDQLCDRIASVGWRQIVKDSNDIGEFRRYIDFLMLLNRLPGNLSDILPGDAIQKIKEHSLLLLTTEDDLLHPENELRNSVLDGDQFDRIYTLSASIPEIDLQADDAYIFVAKLEYCRKTYGHNLFLLEGARLAYVYMMYLLFLPEWGDKRFEKVIKLFQETKNPYIKTYLIFTVKQSYPEVIPYFLMHSALAPLSFELLENMEVTAKWFRSPDGFDANVAISDTVKDELWNELYEILVERACDDRFPENYVIPFAALLQEVSRMVFSFNMNIYSVSARRHWALRKRYDRILNDLKRRRTKRLYHHPVPAIQPLLCSFLLPGIVKYISNFPDLSWPTNYITFPCATVDLKIELLRLVAPELNENLEKEYQVDIKGLKKTLINEIYGILKYYFTAVTIEVQFGDRAKESKNVVRSSHVFGFEIIDFGYLLVVLQKAGLLEQLVEIFNDHLEIRVGDDSHNTEQQAKISSFLKLSLIGYRALALTKSNHQYHNLPVEDTQRELRLLIKELALKHNKDDTVNGCVDVFGIRIYVLGHGLHYEDLDALLYKVLNFLPMGDAEVFINQFFDKSKNFGMLVSAVNRIDDRKIKNLLIDKIKRIDPEKFINSSLYIELEPVLIELVNSHTLFEYAHSFLKRIEDSLTKSSIGAPQKQLMLYQIKMLLALKNKDTKQLQELEQPDFKTSFIDRKDDDIRSYYLGLDQLYNYKDYSAAIGYFKLLHSQYPKRVEYAVYLYKAQTLHNLQMVKPSSAKEEWDEFKKTSKPGEQLAPYAALEQSMDLLHYIWSGDDTSFDHAINRLPASHLYQHFMIVPIYRRYEARRMYDTGYSFLCAAIQYLEDNEVGAGRDLIQLKNGAVTEQVKGKIRENMVCLRSLPAKDIPEVLPAILNGKRELYEFLLGEILNGLTVMRQKIVAVESIIKENHYNDVFLATLRLKFPLFGWEIVDQQRTGQSVKKRDAGEADIIVKAGGNDIAMLEALNMEGRNRTNLEKHIRQCTEYNRNLKYYYMLVYYNGDRSKYGEFISKYKEDIYDLAYPAGWEYDKAKGITDLSGEFDNKENIFLGKTMHGNGDYAFYHVIIDLSKGVIKPNASKKKAKKRT